jgi:formate dehydrogenase maturation protein FdhE
VSAVLLETGEWEKRRRRAEDLQARWPFSAGVLAFYAALLDVQERAYLGALEDAPRPEAVAAYAAERVMPRVIELSAASGPPALVSAVLERFDELDFAATIAAWLRSDELPAIERYLARAAAGPVLEALGEAAGAACEGPRDGVHCPVCGGRPQVGYFAPSPEDLVTGHRYLVCSRCSGSWACARLTCGVCGENDTAKLVVCGELGTSSAELNEIIVGPGAKRAVVPADVRFPHLRIDGCRTCSHYLLTVDVERDPRAVPLVDEIGAIPLDLYARDLALTKLVPNLMGI